MLAILSALALQAAAAPPPPTAAPAPAAAPAMSSQEELTELQRVYAESCDTRAYGTYDDICSNLADQIARFRREMRRDRGRHDTPPANSPAAPVPPTP